MAQRKKRATIGKKKSKLRAKARKGSAHARGKAMKRRKAKPITKIRPKRAAAKKPARGRARPAKPPRTPTETVSVDLIEEAPSGEITITEFEEVREETEGGPEQPGETPPETEER
jgi:hypothetical protein